MINLVSNEKPIDLDFWSQIRVNVRRSLNLYGPRNFFTWQSIKFTMLVENADYIPIETKYLIEKNEYEVKNIVSRQMPELKNNTIHHLYSIQRWIEETKFDLEKVKSIIEFGGGFGSTCHAFYELGFTGSYTIFDFPEFLSLQEYYLGKLGLATQRIDKKDFKWDCDLFVAQWSLSESTKEERDEILSQLKTNHFLVSYSEYFDDNDNKEYFEQLTKQPALEIAHLPKHYYIFT